jgi:hypothetical protein
MSDQWSEVWGKVILRAPNLGPKLAQDMVRNAFRKLAERRRWSWLVKQSQIIAPAVTNTGTATVTLNSTIITGSGTSWTNALVGQQFRRGLLTPIYTIVSVESTTQLTLDQPWGSVTAAGVRYEIYQAFFTMPSDFHQLISIYDPSFNWRLHLEVDQSEINAFDAQRANSGNAYLVSFRDYSTSQIGLVAQPVQVLGSGNDPASSGTYTGPANAIFTIEITTAGAPGTAVYRWKKDSGSYTSLVTTDATGAAQTLQDGVMISFPTGVSYTLADIWVIRTTALSNPGTPRYEMYPHQQAAHVYGMMYETLPVDISDPGATIPRAIPGDLLTSLAMVEVAMYPGTDSMRNPYFNPAIARMYETQVESRLNLTELRDEEVWCQNLEYTIFSWPLCPIWLDSRFIQSHSI